MIKAPPLWLLYGTGAFLLSHPSSSEYSPQSDTKNSSNPICLNGTENLASIYPVTPTMISLDGSKNIYAVTLACMGDDKRAKFRERVTHGYLNAIDHFRVKVTGLVSPHKGPAGEPVYVVQKVEFLEMPGTQPENVQH